MAGRGRGRRRRARARAAGVVVEAGVRRRRRRQTAASRLRHAADTRQPGHVGDWLEGRSLQDQKEAGHQPTSMDAERKVCVQASKQPQQPQAATQPSALTRSLSLRTLASLSSNSFSACVRARRATLTTTPILFGREGEAAAATREEVYDVLSEMDGSESSDK